MAPPRSGRRGDLQSLALAQRSSPFREDHDASATVLPEAPTSWASHVEWFVECWQASLPARLHTRGVEDGGEMGGLGSPRMSGAMHARIDHVTAHGWGVTGWDRDGRPRGMTDDGTMTRDPFLFYLEMRLKSKDDAIRMGAEALVWWAYMAWDTISTAILFARKERMGAMLPTKDVRGKWFAEAFESMLERNIRQLWHDCQREPVRFRICAECRRRDCICGQRSEAQVNAEEAA